MSIRVANATRFNPYTAYSPAIKPEEIPKPPPPKADIKGLLGRLNKVEKKHRLMVSEIDGPRTHQDGFEGMEKAPLEDLIAADATPNSPQPSEEKSSDTPQTPTKPNPAQKNKKAVKKKLPPISKSAKQTKMTVKIRKKRKK
jgi:uncharacterized membrane protein